MADSFDEEEGQQTMTIDEYLEVLEERELKATLVLGGGDDDECTYAKGYKKRQAIFSCLTCTPEGNAGICPACCLTCHDGHELLELWTKRNFRCDCGNSKFGDFSCKLTPNKDPENIENSYNHNYKGLYCTCNRPYPDPDLAEQEEMIQCCMCEDWFHEEHLTLNSPNEIPRDEESEPLYEDFICKACSPVCSFLSLYPPTIWAVGVQTADPVTPSKDKSLVEDTNQNGGSAAPVTPSKDKSLVEDTNQNGGSAAPVTSSKDKSVVEDTNQNGGSIKPCSDARLKKDNTIAETVVGESSQKNDEKSHVSCVLGVDPVTAAPSSEAKPLFLSQNWRDALCKCQKCLDMYKQKNISYLVDKEDSIAEYETKAKAKREEDLKQQESAAANVFDNLGHIEKMEILHGINDFKDELVSMLGSLDPTKAVTGADVRQMFDNLKNKRRRVD